MNPAFLAEFKVTEEITAILVEAGLDAKVAIPDEDREIPLWLGVFVTDPREPKAIWEFHSSDTEGDPYGWAYQIGTYVGDEYEGIVYEDLGPSPAYDAPAEEVARAIQKVIEIGIEPNDLAQIVSAYDGMLER